MKYLHVGVGTFESNAQIEKNVAEVLESGRISYGEKSEELEERFAELHGCKYAILSNSGTSALQVALQAMKEKYGWADGDEVIVPATTFVATPNIVIHNRMKPVFVDVETETYGINNNICYAVTEKTRAIIPVHLFGQPCNINNNVKGFLSGSEKRHIKIIEDSCETMFVKHHGQPVGSMGEIGCFSMYVAHLLVAGIGGICTTNDLDLAKRMRSLVNHGIDIEQIAGDGLKPIAMPGRRFRFTSHGHSFRVTEFEAAVALAQLDNHKEMLRIRRKNARQITAGLHHANEVYDAEITPPTVAEGNEHAWMMLPILLKKGTDKNAITQFLNNRGIETRDMLPLIGNPIYDTIEPDNYPISKWIAESGFYVGCHQDLTNEQVEHVRLSIIEWFDKNRSEEK